MMNPHKTPKSKKTARGSKAKAAPKAAKATPKAPKAKKTSRAAAAYKADVATRLGAAAADLMVGTVPAGAILIQGGIWISATIVIAYLLLRDGIPIQQLDYKSIGKKILGLHVEIEGTGETKLDPLTSIKRNITLVPGLALMPVVWGFNGFLALFVAAIPPLIEMYKVITDPNGLRFGDAIAGTKVLD